MSLFALPRLLIVAALLSAGPLLAACQKQPPPAPTQAAPMSLSEVQSGLKRLGLYRGSVDGIMGPQTEAAIKAFQRQNRLAETGVRSPRMEQALRVALSDGSEGSTVAAAPTPQTSASGAPLSQARTLVRRSMWPASLEQIDLNGDGQMDVIAKAEWDSGLCGAQACSHMILINRGGGYEVVIDGLYAIQLTAQQSRTRGYRDLSGYAHGSVPFGAKWDGRTYQYSG
ncbi:MAG: peptidoglycan-binding domain-containing protein [Pseudomonadota bacterium]